MGDPPSQLSKGHGTGAIMDNKNTMIGHTAVSIYIYKITTHQQPAEAPHSREAPHSSRAGSGLSAAAGIYSPAENTLLPTAERPTTHAQQSNSNEE